MLMALLAAYFLGGGGVAGSILTSASVKNLSSQVEMVVDDPARADQAQELFAQLRKEVKAFEKGFAKSGKRLTKAYKDHAADVAEALLVLDELNSGWTQSQQSALDLRFELKELLTEDEWAALFPKTP